MQKWIETDAQSVDIQFCIQQLGDDINIALMQAGRTYKQTERWTDDPFTRFP